MYPLPLGVFIHIEISLLVAHEDGYRSAVEIPLLAYLVFQETSIGFLHPLRQVAEKDECRYDGVFQHRDVFDFYEFSLVAGRRSHGDLLKHIRVELRGRDNPAAILIYRYGRLQHLVDSLLGQRGGKQHGEIRERRELYLVSPPRNDAGRLSICRSPSPTC